jgi:phosphotriesterase-related protein
VFIRTVTGDIDPEELGFTHCHEHLFTCRIAGVDLPDRLIIDSRARSRREVAAFREMGGRALVDAQPFGAGRNVRYLYRLSRSTGVHVIGATGFHKTYFYPGDFWAFDAGVDDIAELFIGEIETGMYEYDPVDPFKVRSDIRAGIIKIATDADGLTHYYEKVFRAAARAHRETGAPVMTHTELSRFGPEQVEFLNREGVSSESIILSHMDRVIDVEENLVLAERGVYLEYDTIGRFKYHSDEDEAALISTMVDRGHGDRILLGLDVTRDRMVAYGGEVGLNYLSASFIPLLKESGVDGARVNGFMEENPRRALSFKTDLKASES